MKMCVHVACEREIERKREISLISQIIPPSPGFYLIVLIYTSDIIKIYFNIKL